MSGNFTSLRCNPDLLCHCNLFISLFSASGFPSFKEHFKEHLSAITSNIAYTIGKAILRNLKLCSVFKRIPNGKTWYMAQ